MRDIGSKHYFTPFSLFYATCNLGIKITIPFTSLEQFASSFTKSAQILNYVDNVYCEMLGCVYDELDVIIFYFVTYFVGQTGPEQ